MTYLPIIISVASLLFAVYSLVSKNSKDTTTELTTVMIKLENIGDGIRDIKADIAGLKADQKEDHDRMIKVESSLNAAWTRIDELKEIKISDDGR